MNNNFDLQGWMRENKQGSYGRLDESLLGSAPLYPINEASSMAQDAAKWEALPIETKEELLMSVDNNAEEGLADYAYVAWSMVPDNVKDMISRDFDALPMPKTDMEDEDEMMSKKAMKAARRGNKEVSKLNPDKDINDILYGDDEEDLFEEELDESSPESIDRMEGIADEKALQAFKNVFPMLVKDWMEDGFEQDDIIDYVSGIGGFSTKHPFFAGEMNENIFSGGSREESQTMLEYILDMGVSEKTILDHVLFNWMSSDDAEAALRDFAKDYDLLDMEDEEG